GSVPRCTALTNKGEPCRVPAMPGSAYCFFHRPDLAEARAAGRKKGSQRRKVQSLPPGEKPEVSLGSTADVITFLGLVANEVYQGRLAPKRGNCLSLICSTLLRGLEVDLTAELIELREALETRTKGNGRAA